MKNFEMFEEKILKELEKFRKGYNNMEKIQIYNDWYIISFYEVLSELLLSDYMRTYYEEIIEWLHSKKSPLNFLYEEWLGMTGSFSEDWTEIISWISVIYNNEK